MVRRICFVGSDNYPVLNPVFGKEGNMGGESVQQTLLAKTFVELGYEVSMVVHDLGQPQGEVIDGIRVWKTFMMKEGIPIFRFIYPRMTSIMRALRKANADIYYQSCAGATTGFVAWFCKKYERKFIFRVAHDTDCIPDKQLIKWWRDKKIYEYGLRNANLIAAQSDRQVGLLQKHYGLPSVPLNMAVELPKGENGLDRDIDILWVNNIRAFKRPELVIEVARRIPEGRFVIIGGPCPGYNHLYQRVEAQARVLPNLQFLGFVPYHRVNAYYARAKLFINTSDSEGFPNSFLQSWVRGTPVISFFDPDGLLQGSGLGLSPRTLEEMVEAVHGLLHDDKRRVAMGEKAREFALANYSPRAVAGHYKNLIEGMIQEVAR